MSEYAAASITITCNSAQELVNTVSIWEESMISNHQINMDGYKLYDVEIIIKNPFEFEIIGTENGIHNMRNFEDIMYHDLFDFKEMTYTYAQQSYGFFGSRTYSSIPRMLTKSGCEDVYDTWSDWLKSNVKLVRMKCQVVVQNIVQVAVAKSLVDSLETSVGALAKDEIHIPPLIVSYLFDKPKPLPTLSDPEFQNYDHDNFIYQLHLEFSYHYYFKQFLRSLGASELQIKLWYLSQ